MAIKVLYDENLIIGREDDDYEICADDVTRDEWKEGEGIRETFCNYSVHNFLGKHFLRVGELYKVRIKITAMRRIK